MAGVIEYSINEECPTSEVALNDDLLDGEHWKATKTRADCKQPTKHLNLSNILKHRKPRETIIR